MNKKQPPILKFLIAGGTLAFGTQLLVLYTAFVNDIHSKGL
ncbi:MAG TPA: hypothetical protein VI146_02825 [Nitrososphaeraceae archaeon]